MTQTTTPDNSSYAGVSQPPAATSAANQPEAGGLSPGAAAGVGVGVAVGILVLAGAAFFTMRRRKQRRRLPPTEGHGSSDAGVLQSQDVHTKPDLSQPSEMAVYERPAEMPT